MSQSNPQDSLVLMTLLTISVVDLPDEQTVTFVKRVQEWLSQWTVKNNYDRYCVAKGNEKLVLLEWRESFISSFKSAVSEITPRDGDIDRHFFFSWLEEDLQLNSKVTKSVACGVCLTKIAKMEK